MKDLKDLTLQEYNKIKSVGMLFELFPLATGNPNADLEAVLVYVDHMDNPFKLPTYFWDIIDDEAVYE